MPDWTAYVRSRLRLHNVRPQHEQDVVDDLAGQLEEAYREAIARGLSPGEAEAAAADHIRAWPALARDVANSRRVAASLADRVEVRASDAAAAGSRGAGLVAGVLQDARFAIRLARRAPGFTAIAILTLALGIGANTTIFSWINAILLDPLPGADARRVVDVSEQSKTGAHTATSYPDFMDLRAAATTVQLLVHDMTAASLARPSGAERIWIEIVSDNFFEVLRVPLVAGRAFQPAEGRAPIPVIVISERLSQERFAGRDPINQTLIVNGTPFTIVGVASARFASGYTGLMMDAWLPIQMSEKVMPGANRVPARNNHWLNALARLEPGVSAFRAAAELTEIMARIAAANGGDVNRHVTIVPLWRSPRGAQSVMGPVLLVLMGMVAIVLLLACTNLANLFLSRASARRREFALRLSLGCARGRLIRQLLTESLILVSVAALAALIAQIWTAGLLTSFVPPNNLPIGLAASLDLRVTIFPAVVAFVTAVLVGMLPALQAGRTDLAASIKGDAGQVAGGRRAWLRSSLVVSQIALSMLLLVSAGLFIRSLGNVRLLDLGFRTDGVLLSSVDLFSAGYDRATGRQVLTRILDEIRALPGVESASLARRVPLGISTGSSSTTLEPEGYEAPKDEPAWTYLNWVAPDYFRTMRIPVLAGREFTIADRDDRPELFIVNRTFADRYWPGQNAVGKRIRLGKESYEVVGVVGNSKYRRLNEPESPFVYLSTTWNYRPDVVFHMRTSSDPRQLAAPVRAVIQRADPALPVFDVTTLSEYVQAASFQHRLAASLLTAFGALALVLASIGLYATTAYSVSRRTQELGARLALGATRGDIMRLVLGQALRLSAVGLLIGLALAMAATQFFDALLVGVRPLDPGTFLGVTLVLTSIAVLASYMPARRAARLDPLQALRYE
jgi:putative ABC transport system permease protein